MRLGTFNVENMFDRAAAMNLPTWAEGKPILEDFKRLNNLIGIEMYSNADKRGWWGNPWGFKSRLRHHGNTQRDFGFPPKSLF
jgi:hypothetical protein